MKYVLTAFCFLLATLSFSQKKPLDHSVYDSWQTIGERVISNDGQFVSYGVVPQEGDATLVIQKTSGDKLTEISRGYNVRFSDDNKFVVFKIKPTYQQTRDARIKKKKPDEMPKDSLGIFEIATRHLQKIPRVKNFKMAEKSGQWLAYSLEKPQAEVDRQRKELDSLSRIKLIANVIDSLTRVTDSLRNKLVQVQTAGLMSLNPAVQPLQAKSEENTEEGTELIVMDLTNGKKQYFRSVNDYYLSKSGNILVFKTVKKGNIPALILKENLFHNSIDTIFEKFNDAKGIAIDEKGEQIAFVAERDSSKKESQKFYKLFYYKNNDSALLLADRFTKGVPAKWTVSEFGNVYFSKSGNRLFFGTAPIIPQKDTTLPDFERVSVDIWNYKDDDLMPYQLKFMDTLLKRNFLARYDFDKKEVVQLGDEKLVRVNTTMEGDGNVFYAGSDYGKRVEKQWQGYTLEDWYAIDPNNGNAKQIVANWKGNAHPSFSGKYLLLYSEPKKQYFIYNNEDKKLSPVALDIKVPLYDEEADEPNDPSAHGIVKWMADDKYVLIYDKYDIWKVDPAGKEKSVTITNGRKDKTIYRYDNLDPEEKFITPDQQLVFRTMNEKNKNNGIAVKNGINGSLILNQSEASHIVSIVKAKNSKELLLVKETFQNSPNVYVADYGSEKQWNLNKTVGWGSNILNFQKLSNTNPQQENYLWGTSELFKWKAYNTGRETEGILYKPENFDAKKKYPMIVYFYDRNNTTLNNYQPPSPTPSRLNISFFVSRGYVVFVPDIWYQTGHPGQSAYDCIVSGTRALIKLGFIDSTKIGLQGQSWGGYQTAILITKTNLYHAAWAGAPVVNMFSAYGGVRWETGVTRQMQYEKGQSRIGATIWEKPNLYIENSPLFHLEKINTPLVIMSNDADGAVPWYQGIEFFTAMRRLHKPVWLLNYNGEAHNLVERRNRKDIQIREQQFFDWKLKGAPAPKWITEGVPAVMKGRDLGLGM